MVQGGLECQAAQPAVCVTSEHSMRARVKEPAQYLLVARDAETA